MAQEKKKTKGWIYLGIWAFLILAGIIAKRIFGHPDLMVFFHLPAAVFLVLAFYELSSDVRQQYKVSLQSQAPLPLKNEIHELVE